MPRSRPRWFSLSMVLRGRSAPLGGRARAGPGSPRWLRAHPALLAPSARSAIAAGSRSRTQPGRVTTNGRVGLKTLGLNGETRQDGLSRAASRLEKGRGDPPSGKKFRSKPQLARYLGNAVDLSSFDFRTGKMMPSKLQKNKQKLRNDALNPNKGKPDLNTSLPIRQTASIFKQPVTKVTNHPGNKVRSDPQRVSEQPKQLFWEKRLQGLSASDVSEEIIKCMELPKGLQGVGPGASTESLLSAVDFGPKNGIFCRKNWEFWAKKI
ncbi:methyl-CpG-binding domain protein 2-like isoform X2 [Zonotrichia albicollis]|uniref:methyl-CpG-binding domain protein 2-like isoform X2 n=1 Tax=Zonotrichia albicollis TaxID=44394 RepID=UPI003D812100